MPIRFFFTLIAALVTAIVPVAVDGETPESGRFTVNKGQALDPVTIRALQSTENERIRYRGLVVKAQSGVEGDELLLQNQVGSLLSQFDYVPQERLDHFAWLRDCQTVVTGWEGTITRMEVLPAGVCVTILVHPRNTVGIAAIDDLACETYLCSAAGVHFLGSQRLNTERPRVVTIN